MRLNRYGCSTLTRRSQPFAREYPWVLAIDVANGQPQVVLYFPLLPNGKEARFGPLEQSDDADFSVARSRNPMLKIEWIAAPFPLLRHSRWLTETFPARVREQAFHHQLVFVGIFEDDLVSELRTVMVPEDVPVWLHTPNALFGGIPPIELVDDPLDRRLRDVITRAKFNLPAA
jgi:hypothetical protein